MLFKTWKIAHLIYVHRLKDRNHQNMDIQKIKEQSSALCCAEGIELQLKHLKCCQNLFLLTDHMRARFKEAAIVTAHHSGAC